MTDQDLLAELEACRLDQFSHADHVRAGWAYLQSYSTAVAIERFATSLRRFAESKGAAGKYHATITWAYMLLIAERIHRGRATTWTQFAAANADLFKAGGRAVLGRYYSRELLGSELARRVFVLPDRASPPAGDAASA